MTRTLIKWTYRCLGWILLGALGLGCLVVYGVDKHQGYGNLWLRLTWNDEAYVPAPTVLAGAELKVRRRAYPLKLRQPLRLRPGPAVVELKLKDFLDSHSAVTVPKDGTAKLDVSLHAEPRTITLRNLVPGATIAGKPCGATWVFANAEVGQTYTFPATAPGCETNFLKLRIDEPGKDLVANLELRPLMGGLAINVAPVEGTEVFLNGVLRDPASMAPLRVGVYSITATNPDYYPFALTVEVTYGATNTAHVRLLPKPASVAIEVTPTVDFQVRDAEGSLLPVNEGRVHPAPGPAKLTIAADGFVSVQREFSLEPNQAYSWSARLEREGQLDFQRMKEKFRLLTTDPETAPQLAKLGGVAWKAVRLIEFDNEHLLRGARQYTEACATISEIVQTFPERGRAWTNEMRAANAIDYWLVLGELGKAANEINQYAARFGPQSDFARWFGSTAGKIQDWQDALENKKRYLPEQPVPKKR